MSGLIWKRNRVSDMATLAQHELILHSLKSKYRVWRCVSTNAFIARFPRLSMKMLLRPHLAFRNMVWIGFSSYAISFVVAKTMISSDKYTLDKGPD